MTEQQDPREEQYERARRAFEDLRIEDRAFFLVREAVATIAHGIETAGRALADEFDAIFRKHEVAADETKTDEAKAGEKARARKRKTPPKRTRAKKTPPKGTNGEDGGVS